jgi:hypothetical protein
MPGELSGGFFKPVVSALLMAEVLFPEIKKRIDAMDVSAWYPWDEYIEVVNTIAAKLSDASLVKCGVNSVRHNKPFYEANGFHSMGDMMSMFGHAFNAAVRDAPDNERAHVLESSPNHVVLRFGIVQPRGLCEGYIRGNAIAFDATIDALTYSAVEDEAGYRYHQFNVRWREAGQPLS